MKYAFDKKNNIIYAKDLDHSYSGIKFKCPNPDCNGEVLLRNSNSNYKSSCFYFRNNIKDKFGSLVNNHIDKCWALSSSNSSIYSIENFKFNKFINNITTTSPNNSTKQQQLPHTNSNNTKDNIKVYNPSIHTLKQLYNFCSTSLPYTQIGDVTVKDIFVGETTLQYFKINQNKIYSPMLFHLKRVYKSENFSRLEFYAYCNSTYSKLYLKFKIKFEDEFLFKTTMNSFFYNKSRVKFKKVKFDFLVLAIPGKLTPIENSNFYIQELIVTKSSHVHII